ncbi:hypothetical protein H257_08780 [Aphanomyces astaci]|uniref:Uncharacterized protein n=1 Tax=Aphanomyces astaci TaxID=112090 RepID=W4GE39_APHAT|nr:hypothetical protein H257_08780 [Aphanomyces astaci]ETV77334.1 hypothetical protein H257_08780 [Aphanomyces astaci]|eukprot:XP_009833121.1 hypothetical protein H257_08780 [Aphanomyces astaci]
MAGDVLEDKLGLMMLVPSDTTMRACDVGENRNSPNSELQADSALQVAANCIAVVQPPCWCAPHQNSLSLAASATHAFDPKRWVAHEVYYVDQASAAINGILSLRIQNTFYIFDLKIWRVFVIEEPADIPDRLVRDALDQVAPQHVAENVSTSVNYYRRSSNLASPFAKSTLKLQAGGGLW